MDGAHLFYYFVFGYFSSAKKRNESSLSCCGGSARVSRGDGRSDCCFLEVEM